MTKFKQFILDLSSTAKAITAIIGACSVIIGLLLSITIKVTSIANDFNKAVAVVPIVERHTKDIEGFKKGYVIRNDFDEHRRFVITEIDVMIDDTMRRVENNQKLGTRYVSRLIYYRDNLSFLSNKQISMINVIEKFYNKQESISRK